MPRFMIIFLFLCSSAFASEQPISRFNQHYKESQALARNGEFAQAADAAIQALKIAEEIELGQEQIANLQFNIGFLLNQSRRYPQACEAFELALENYEALQGDTSPYLINTLDNLGSCYSEQTSKGNLAKKNLQRARSIAKASYGESSPEHARALFRLGQAMLMYLGEKRGDIYVKQSLELFDELLGTDSNESRGAQFTLAKFELARKKYSRAAGRFNNILETFDDPDNPSSKLELSIHGFLVETYEADGKSDLATKHCLAIGQMTPAQDVQDYMPLFKPRPTYPPQAIRSGKTGKVIVEFDVDEQGFVQNPKVVAREGSNIFDDPSLEVVKRFRYAPRFVDGKAVHTTGVKNRIVYALSR